MTIRALLCDVADTARAKQLPLAATALCENYFRGAQANGAGRLGTHAISQVIERLGKFKFAD